jgi:hypothetical protein
MKPTQFLALTKAIIRIAQEILEKRDDQRDILFVSDHFHCSKKTGDRITASYSMLDLANSSSPTVNCALLFAESDDKSKLRFAIRHCSDGIESKFKENLKTFLSANQNIELVDKQILEPIFEDSPNSPETKLTSRSRLTSLFTDEITRDINDLCPLIPCFLIATGILSFNWNTLGEISHWLLACAGLLAFAIGSISGRLIRRKRLINKASKIFDKSRQKAKSNGSKS